MAKVRPNQPTRPTGSNPSNPLAPIVSPTALAAAASGYPDDKAALHMLLDRIEKIRGNPLISYWLQENARISQGAIFALHDQLQQIGRVSTIDVVLHTTGGDAEAPWRLVSLLREYCSTLNVLVPYIAFSAGTLFALGANEIVMTPLGVLGPIDPSRTHPLLPMREGATEAEPVSVQDMRHAMQFIRESFGSEGTQSMPYTPEAMAQIFTALFDKIHPLAIGAIEQSYALAKIIGSKCLGTHMDAATEQAKINEIVNKLCDEFKTHNYPINRREAKALGLKITEASEPLEKALDDLLEFYRARRIASSPPVSGKPFNMLLGWIDSQKLNIRVEGKYKVEPDGRMTIQGDAWVPY